MRKSFGQVDITKHQFVKYVSTQPFELQVNSTKGLFIFIFNKKVRK